MLVQDSIEQLRRQKTSHSTEEMDRLGWARYEEIRGELERDHRGDYVMIELDSRDYYMGRTPHDALRQAEAAHPDKAFYLVRVGYKAVHKLRKA